MKVLLTSVRIVAHVQPKLQALPHVLSAIDTFADAPALWSIESAASSGLLRLLDRLASREPSVVHAALGRRRFLQGIRSAVINGQLDVLKWWTTHYLPDHLLSNTERIDLIKEAARLGHLKVLRWLHFQYTIPPHEFSPGNYWSLASSHADAVYWLHELSLDVPVKVSLEMAVQVADLGFLQWLLQHKEQYGVQHTDDIIYIAMERNDLATIQWVIANLMRRTFHEGMLSAHFSHGHLNEIWEQRWPYEYYGPGELNFYRHYDTTQRYVPEVTEDQLRVFRWINNEFEWKNPRYRDRWVDGVALHAACCNNFEMIKALEGNKSKPRPGKRESPLCLPMWLAAFHGHLGMVQWLHEQGERFNTNDAMDGAAAGGHLKIVQWLHQNQPYGPKKEVVDVAAWNGHVDILQWLHTNAPEYNCTHRAMDLAASRGHLPVVQWLHANRSEGCTMKAINGAIANGHLNIIQWLHSNSSEESAQISIDQVIAMGHVEIADFLHSNRPKCAVSSGTLKKVVEKGNLKMVQWLQTNLSPVWTQETLDTAVSKGHVGVVKYVVQHCELRCTETTIQTACDAGLFGLIEWLLVHGPDPETVVAGLSHLNW